MLNKHRFMFVLMLALALSPAIHAKEPPTLEEKKALASKTLEEFRAEGPIIQQYLDKAYGYVIFPVIGQGGFILGGGHGSGGMVYERGRLVGTSSLTLVSIGFQIGGEKFRELIFFEDKATMDRFKKGKIELDASASAVMAKAGTSTGANFTGGMAIFTKPVAGAMAKATVGTQIISYKPLGQ
jgi:lipid-binding SYLF domain-containing protein